MAPRYGCEKEKIYLFGEKGSGTKIKGPLQDFYELREMHLESNTLFEDENFPANDSSLYFKEKNPNIVWRRPKEIRKNYNDEQFFVDGHSQFDAIQGLYGNCWLVASIANLTLRRNLVARVVPDNQDFGENYAGIFHFCFWQYGKWIDVVVDDRLPYNKTLSKLHSLQSRQKNEFWSPLLEKAYAKLHGCYEALNAGFTLDAMEDFTGGITEVYRAENPPDDLFDIIQTAFQRSALVTCTMKEKNDKVFKANHAYSITKVQHIQRKYSQEKIPLIRIRNPHGIDEWEGAWSDRSPEWQSISEEEKKQIGLVVSKTDGEFWMSYEDFKYYYLRVEICNLCPHSASEDHLDSEDKDWKVSSVESKWVEHVTAGGSLQQDTFHCNPQYIITLTRADKNEDQCTLVLGLLQKYRRYLRLENLSIGCEIFQLDDTITRPLNAKFFQTHDPVVEIQYVELREHTNRLKLPPGKYCIIPCTSGAQQEGEFLLRMFSEGSHTLEEYDDDIGYKEGNIDGRVHVAQESLKEQRENYQAYELFLKYAGELGVLRWNKLKSILDAVLTAETSERGFPKDACRCMIAMLDRDQSGYLDFNEFKSLWNDIQIWKNVFHLCDDDNSGALNSFELRIALNSAEFNVNSNILNLLMHRYRNEEHELEFDDFILCAVKLKTTLSMFEEQDPDKTGNVAFTFNKWLETTLYA